MYQIEHLTLCDGWVNTWSDDDGEPIVFVTEAQAIEELKEYLEDLAHDSKHRFISDYDSADYRVTKLG
jgi:hypothetical protein